MNKYLIIMICMAAFFSLITLLLYFSSKREYIKGGTGKLQEIIRYLKNAKGVFKRVVLILLAFELGIWWFDCPSFSVLKKLKNVAHRNDPRCIQEQRLAEQAGREKEPLLKKMKDPKTDVGELNGLRRQISEIEGKYSISNKSRPQEFSAKDDILFTI